MIIFIGAMLCVVFLASAMDTKKSETERQLLAGIGILILISAVVFQFLCAVTNLIL